MDLGVSMIIAGSTMWLLVFSDYIAAGDPQAAIRQMSADVMELYEYEKTPTRFANLDLWMFRGPASPTVSPPLLKGKGAEVRHLIPILHLMWGNYAHPTSVHDKHVDQLLRCLSDIYSVLGWKTDDHETPLFLSEEAAAELRNPKDVFLMEKSYLEKLALERDPPLLLWHMVSKFHSMWHMALESTWQHPSASRTYMNEDMMQHCKRVGMANRHAVPNHRRTLTIAARFSLGKSLELFVDNRNA
jgi:hypothetical protein